MRTSEIKHVRLGSLLLLAFAAMMTASAQRGRGADLQKMVETERGFARTSEEKGIREAFTAFIADDGILFRPRAVLGKKWMEEHPLPPSTTRPLLSWQPIFAAISRAGDLGYTTGPWQFKDNIKDAKPSGFGNFMTVWKKQADGRWKFVLDLGITNPQPKTHPQFLSVEPPSPRFTRVNADRARSRLLKIERDFSKASETTGAVTAFLSYAAADVRLFRDNHDPFVGRKTAVTALTPLSIAWTWSPAFADVSISGDLGYSYGSYELRNKAQQTVIESGNYARVWRKVSGAWKVVIDVADAVPPEKKN